MYHAELEDGITFAPSPTVTDAQIDEMNRDLADVRRNEAAIADAELEQMAQHGQRVLAGDTSQYRAMYTRWERRQLAKERRAARKAQQQSATVAETQVA